MNRLSSEHRVRVTCRLSPTAPHRVLEAGEVIEVGILLVSVGRQIQLRHGVNYQDAVTKSTGGALPACADSALSVAPTKVLGSRNQTMKRMFRMDAPLSRELINAH